MPRSRRAFLAGNAWLSGLPACLALSVLLGGCAVNPPISLSELEPSGAAPTSLDVPFFPQEEHQCGPAALATILVASGIDTSPAELVPQVYLPEREGSLQVELMSAARRQGRMPYVLSPEPASIVAEIRAGRPVLVLQNLRVPSWPAWHYAVITGLDPSTNTFVLNSGVSRNLTTPAPRFLRTWNWAGRWAMVTLLPGEMPATAEAKRFFEAAAAFEAVAGAEDALPAWRSAARQWPRDPTPRLALGNSAYARGDLQEAVRHYAEGLSLQPDDPVLANNLATVLGEMGCPRAGERVLAPVTAATGEGTVSWSEVLHATKRELASQPGEDPLFCKDAARPPVSTRAN
jgi:hypothetical protein